MNEFEKLKFLETKIEKLKELLVTVEKFPNVVLSNTPYSHVPFYEQTDRTKRPKAIPAIRALPPGAEEVIKTWIERELKEAEKEFSESFE